MKKISFSSVATILLVAALVVCAVGFGAVRGWNSQREEVLLECVQRHSDARNIARSVEECREAIDDFDHRLSTELLGRIAGKFGVEPIGDSVESLHSQLLRESGRQDNSSADFDLSDAIENLIDEHVDTSLSLGKVIGTIILLTVLFGKKGRRKGFTIGKLLAGFGLFRMWKKD